MVVGEVDGKINSDSKQSTVD